ncbi:MAG: hypothetical protein UT35_C0002G0002 [Candidatus Yanofskybacteria bacterium GW2011_GWD1_39_16]|uniref:Uncharacterized protein n=1 Tax=Candidatus Yanofskybacteria bacterium GW2011_GWD1_39_16 TaxID=1619030 RepID=A0A837HSK2_9BACT|nr:MAG: hypothetical protein UT35_C0002G0002 [Candidatus Yanofskybacteria bacterium GW2011_GWD1_39_16]
MERLYKISVDADISIRAENKKEALKKAEEAMKFLEVHSFKVQPEKRTLPQNRSLHLLFTQIAKECLDKGIEMRQLVKENVPIEVTPENIKWLWKLLQNALFKTKSTTELKKTGQIEVVYDNFAKIVSERTQGEIILPPFPSLKNQPKEKPAYDYPASIEPTF